MPGVPPARYAYLGPEGTFTEQALRSLPAAAKSELQPCSTVTLALDAVRTGEADGAVVPIENSVEGSVPVTLDELATGEPLMITREMTVPIAFSLLARPGTAAEDVRRIATHPHAAAQTRRWTTPHPPRDSAAPAPRGGRAHLLDGARGLHADPAGRGLGRGDLRSRGGAALPSGDPGHQHRGQRGRADPVRAGVPTGSAAAAHRTGQDLDRRVHAGRPPGRADGDPRPAHDAGCEPDPDRVPPDRGRARQLLLLDRLRGARAGRPGRGGADGAAADLRGRPLPGLLRTARRHRPGDPAGHDRP